MSYLIAAYAVVLVALALYALQLQSERRRLREEEKAQPAENAAKTPQDR